MTEDNPAVKDAARTRTVEHDVPALVSLFRRSSDTYHVLQFVSRGGVVMRAKVERRLEGENVVLWLRALTPEVEDLSSAFKQTGGGRHEDTLFENFVQSVQNLVANVERCRHCSMIFNNQRGMWDGCVSCMAASASRLRAEDCVICKSQLHPIAFVCKTCWDSQICTACFANLARPGCQICRARCKRLRFDDFSDDEASEKEGQDEGEI